jgi:hypothetical protein
MRGMVAGVISLLLRGARGCGGVAGVLALAAAIPAPASAAIVAQPGGPTAVRAYGGTIVFSEYDQATHRWYLSVRMAGAKTAQRLNIAPSPVAFNADIGPDSRGRPELIYQRCAASGLVQTPYGSSGAINPTSCDLFVYSLTDGTERPVRNANDPSHNDVNPTLWRGRIAWTREYGSGKNANPVIYTKMLTAPRAQPSRRLPGVPQTRCGDVEKLCGPTTYRRVQALELSGDNLAVTVDYACRGCSGVAQSELRLDKLSDGSSRQVAFLVVGLNDQQLVGPSFFDGNLAWYKACGVFEASCTKVVGPWRYRLSTRTYKRGTPGPVAIIGFADTGSRLYESFCPPPDHCRIDESVPPSYAPARAPLR